MTQNCPKAVAVLCWQSCAYKRYLFWARYYRRAMCLNHAGCLWLCRRWHRMAFYTSLRQDLALSLFATCETLVSHFLQLIRALLHGSSAFPSLPLSRHHPQSCWEGTLTTSTLKQYWSQCELLRSTPSTQLAARVCTPGHNLWNPGVHTIFYPHPSEGETDFKQVLRQSQPFFNILTEWPRHLYVLLSQTQEGNTALSHASTTGPDSAQPNLLENIPAHTRGLY